MNELLRKVDKFLTQPDARFRFLSKLGLFDHMSDEQYLLRLFPLSVGYLQ